MEPQLLYEILNATEQDWDRIVNLVEISKLDGHDMGYSQFKVCRAGEELAGIGRIRHHTDCVELCTLWVHESFRKQGIGRALVEELLKGRREPVYLVTEIAPYFSKLGFVASDVELPSLKAKKLLCVEELCCSRPEIMVKNIS